MPNAARRSNFIAASTNGATEAILAATARAAPSRRTPQTTSVTTAENDVCLGERRLREGSMANAAQQMPGHVETAYKAAVDNIIFLKRQKGLVGTFRLVG